MIDLSIVVVGRDAVDLLMDCFRSIQETIRYHTYDVHYIDNGSEEPCVERTRREYPNVQVTDAGQNLGFTRANNIGIWNSSGRYCLALNNDTRLTPGALDGLIEWMDQNPEVGVVGCRLRRQNESIQNSIHTFPTLATELLNRGLLKLLFPRRFHAKPTDVVDPIEVDAVLGAFMLVRREVIDEVGAFDDDYFIFLEETDWCWRIKNAGWKIVYHPGFFIYHIQGAYVKRFPGRMKAEFYRSRYLYFLKHRGHLVRALLMGGLCVRLVISILLGLIGVVATLGCASGIRERFQVSCVLLAWHFLGCPKSWGLSESGE